MLSRLLPACDHPGAAAMALRMPSPRPARAPRATRPPPRTAALASRTGLLAHKVLNQNLGEWVWPVRHDPCAAAAAQRVRWAAAGRARVQRRGRAAPEALVPELRLPVRAFSRGGQQHQRRQRVQRRCNLHNMGTIPLGTGGRATRSVRDCGALHAVIPEPKQCKMLIRMHVLHMAGDGQGAWQVPGRSNVSLGGYVKSAPPATNAPPAQPPMRVSQRLLHCAPPPGRAPAARQAAAAPTLTLPARRRRRPAAPPRKRRMGTAARAGPPTLPAAHRGATPRPPAPRDCDRSAAGNEVSVRAWDTSV